MAITAGTMYGYLQSVYPDASDALCLRSINRTVRALVQPDDSRTESVTLSSLVAGTASYALSESVVRVWSAEYQAESGSTKQLSALTMRQMERDYPNYRVAASASPSSYAVTYTGSALNLTLYPAPDSSSSGGYPRLVLRVSEAPTLTSGSSLPANVSEEAVEAGALWRVARVLDPAKADFYEKLWRQELAMARAENTGRVADARQELFSDEWSFGGIV